MTDICQILIKGHGVYSNVASKSWQSHQRALYEAAAVGFLVHKAGGSTITVGGISLLDYEFKSYGDLLQFGAGSETEVEHLVKIFKDDHETKAHDPTHNHDDHHKHGHGHGHGHGHHDHGHDH